jgi:hypothetical protein
MNAAFSYETLLPVYQTTHYTPYHRNLDIHNPVSLKSKKARNSLSIGKTTVSSGSLRHDPQDMNPVSEHVCVCVCVCGERLHGHRHQYPEMLKTSMWLNVALMVIF